MSPAGSPPLGRLRVVRADHHAPLLVRAELERAPSATGDPVHLDALVAVGAWNALPEEVRRVLPDAEADRVADLYLPLSRWGVPSGLDAGDCASVVAYSAAGEVSAVPVGVPWGWCASASLAPPGRDLEWRAIGCAREVARLLDLVPRVGDAPVRRWRVFPLIGSRARLTWAARDDGRAARRLPVEAGLPGDLAGRGGLRPLYWHPSRAYPACVYPDPLGSPARPGLDGSLPGC